MQGQTPNLKGHREGPLEAICSQKKSSSALEANGSEAEMLFCWPMGLRLGMELERERMFLKLSMYLLLIE